MKDEFNHKCLYTALYCFITIAAAMLFFFIIKDLPATFSVIKAFLSVFRTFFIALAFAYILNPAIAFFKKCFSRFIKKESVLIILSTSLTYILVVIFLSVFVWQLIPALTNNITFFASNFNSYLNAFRTFVVDISNNLSLDQHIFDFANNAIISTAEYITGWFSVNFLQLVNMIFETTNIILDFIVAFILSIYMSLSRNKLLAQTKKLMLAFFPRRFCDRIMTAAYSVNDSFSGYMSGIFVSSILIGLLCWICMTVFGIEYAPLISFIVMITDVIPYFGPFIGAALGSVLLVLVKPWDALWFLIIILILQQITSNFINPKIIGKATGLDSIYVILSIIVMGGFFGVLGMVIGVPIFVIIIKAVRKFISLRIKEDYIE